MTSQEIKVYIDYDTEEVINALYEDEVYYVMRTIEDTEEYTKYEIDQLQNANRNYWECTESRELVVYKDDITYCTLDGVGLVVINR